MEKIIATEEIAAGNAEKSACKQAEHEALEKIDPPTMPVLQSSGPKDPFMNETVTSNQCLEVVQEKTPKSNLMHEYSNNTMSTPHYESLRRIVEIQDQQSSALQQLIHQQPGVMASSSAKYACVQW